jgi:hypothetical protein
VVVDMTSTNTPASATVHSLDSVQTITAEAEAARARGPIAVVNALIAVSGAVRLNERESM